MPYPTKTNWLLDTNDLIVNYRPPILETVKYFIKDSHVCEDITQEILLKNFTPEKIEKTKQKLQETQIRLRTHLRMIVRRRVIDWWRKIYGRNGEQNETDNQTITKPKEILFSQLSNEHDNDENPIEFRDEKEVENKIFAVFNKEWYKNLRELSINQVYELLKEKNKKDIEKKIQVLILHLEGMKNSEICRKNDLKPDFVGRNIKKLFKHYAAIFRENIYYTVADENIVDIELEDLIAIASKAK